MEQDDDRECFEWRSDLATNKIVALKIWKLRHPSNTITKVQLVFSDQVTSPVLGSQAEDDECTESVFAIDRHVSGISCRAVMTSMSIPTKLEMRFAEPDETRLVYEHPWQDNTSLTHHDISEDH